MKRLYFFLALFLCLDPGAYAQLSGNYTLDSAQAASATNFTTFQALQDSLNFYGISGSVTIEVVAKETPYEGPFSLDNLMGTSDSSTLTIHGNDAVLFHQPTSSDPYVLRINGSKHVIIDGLTVRSEDGPFHHMVVQLMNGADSCVVQNCRIEAIGDNTGIILGTTEYVTHPFRSAAYCKILNNEIIGIGNGFRRGIRITGSYWGESTNNEIRGNYIQNMYTHCIYAGATKNVDISENEILDSISSNSGPMVGIVLAGFSPGANIYNNRIHENNPPNGTIGGEGININAWAAYDNPIKVFNNLIYDFDGSDVYGVRLMPDADEVELYHNSIIIDDPSNSFMSDGNVYGMLVEAIHPNISIHNNLIHLSDNGDEEKVGIYFDTDADIA